MTRRNVLNFPSEDHRSQYPSRESVRVDIHGARLDIEYVRDLTQVHRCSVVAVSGNIPPALHRSERSRVRLIRNCRERFIEITALKPDYLGERMQDAISRSS